MKRFIVAAILVGALVALLGGTALAAGPTTPPGQGFRPAVDTQATGACPCGGAGFGTGAGGMMRGGRPEWAGQPDEVATLLGLTEEAIQTKRQAGESLVQIAAAKGVSEDALISTILNAKKATLAKLVADGKLTQTQADLMIQNMTSRIKTMVERTDVGLAFGQGGARRMMGQGMGEGMRGGRWNRS
jgi:hypothetical protein